MNPPRSPPSAADTPPAHRLTAFWIVIAAACCRLATLGAYPLTDASDARYAEMARKILETGQWLVPQFDYGVPFWGKPPLAIWITALGMRLFGTDELGARLPQFLLCAGTGVALFALARRERGRRAAWTASAVFASSALPCYAAGAVLTDPALCFTVTGALCAFWRAVRHGERRWGYVLFVALALGLLVKGPVALALAGLPMAGWCVQQRAVRDACGRLPLARGIALMLALALPWYLAAEYATPGFLDYFVIGENWSRFVHAGWSGDLYGGPHREPRGTIWLFALGATLPWSAVLAWRRGDPAPATPAVVAWRRFLAWWTLTPPIFFTCAGNIVWTYVLAGVPGFALYAAERFGPGGLPVLPRRAAGTLAALVIALLPWNWRFDSEKALVASFHAAQGGRATPLVYALERPYSAEFYTRGTALRLTAAELPAALGRGVLAFVAIPHTLIADGTLRMPPEYVWLADSERFALFRRRSAVLSAAPDLSAGKTRR